MPGEILQEQGISISELAPEAERFHLADALQHGKARDNQKVDFDMLMHIGKLPNVPVERLCEG